MKFFGKKVNNQIQYYNPAMVREYINTLKDSQEVQIEIKVKRKFRSISQNNLYWLWLGVISDDTGFTTDELHGTFKSMFLTDNTQKIPLVRTTTALNTEEFTKYLNKIEDLCREKLNVTLPNPEDLYL